MLVSFSVGNFRSFKDEQTLSMVAFRRFQAGEPADRCFELAGTGEQLLGVAALYGANGAGKSNLVKALQLVQNLVEHGTAPGKRISFQPFKLDTETRSAPMSFDLRFVANELLLRYGFCCDAERVHEEWLDLREGNKERSVFSRVTDSEGVVAVELGSKVPKETDKLRALAKVGARPNQLFLSEVLNLDDADAQGPYFRAALDWIRDDLVLVGPETPFFSLAGLIGEDEQFTRFAGRFLHEASTGILDLEVETKELPAEQLSMFPPELLEELAGGDHGETRVLFNPDDCFELLLDCGKSGAAKIRRVATLHSCSDGSTTQLPLNEESDGSKRLLNLLPVLYRLREKRAVLVVDELERSMHPMLARKLIELFQKSTQAGAGQMIFTTHETNLLDLELLRRDSIWFAEKDPAGASQLYSLADFKVRKDLRVDKGYLQGRFGAIPFLGGIDQLIEEQAVQETSDEAAAQEEAAAVSG